MLTRSFRHLRLACLAGVLWIAACGGGGGSGSGTGTGTGTTNPPATLEVSSTSVSATADVTQPAPTASLQVSVQASTAAQFYIAGSVTHNGVDSVSGSPSGTVDTITVQFKAPAALGPGTYTDTLTLQGCYDQACTQKVTNSPAPSPLPTSSPSRFRRYSPSAPRRWPPAPPALRSR